MQSRPLMRPTPVMMLADETSPPYKSYAASGESSRKGVSGSSRSLTRSRARSLPRATWRARASSLPPRVAAASLSRKSSTRRFMAAELRANSLERGSTAEGRTGMSARLVEKLRPNQHAPDFTGPGADLVELGIPQEPTGRIIVGVAVAAEELNGIERQACGALGRVEDGAGRILARGLAAITGLRHRVDIRLAGVHRHIPVGDLAANQAEFAD